MMHREVRPAAKLKVKKARRSDMMFLEERREEFWLKDTLYKEYYKNIKHYLKKRINEDLLDTFLIKTLSSIYKRYNRDLELYDEMPSEKAFIERCCSEAAKDFEQEYYQFREKNTKEPVNPLSFTLYSMPGVILTGNIRDGKLSLTSEVWGDLGDSESHYDLSKEDTDKLFSMISLEDFIILCQENNGWGMTKCFGEKEIMYKLFNWWAD